MLPTIDELRDQLQAAEERAEATDAAIFNAGAEDEELVDDLEARHEGELKEVARLAKAIARKEAMDTAIGSVPNPEKNDAKRSPARVTSEPLTYRSVDEGGQHSFFQDLYHARKGVPGPPARIARHMREMAIEKRTVADNSTTATDGGDFIPPIYLGEMWKEKKRSGRPYANAVRNLPLPDKGNSMSIPRVTTGSSTAAQDGDNTELSSTALITDDVDVPVETVGGVLDASRQLVDRSSPGWDVLIFDDLARSYNSKLDSLCLVGTGSNGQHEGVLDNSNVGSVTYTSATPTLAELYAKIGEAAAGIAANEFTNPTGIFMHPRRWYWAISQADTTDRPLIAPVAAQNAPGDFGTAAEGFVGSLMGYPVYLDANIPSTGGAGTNQDTVIVSRLDEALLWEDGQPAVEVSEHPGFHTATVRFRLFAYSAFDVRRSPKAHYKITGTGLVDPYA